MTSPPKAAIIIVNYNSGPRLARCLDCLERQTWRDFETIVIDNASNDQSAAAVEGRSPLLRLVDAGANLGFAAANNRAAEGTTAEWLVFLNPDAYADPDWLAALMDAARRYPFADAFGSMQIDAGAPDRLDGAGDVMSPYGVPYRGGFGWLARDAPPDGECFAPCAAAAMYRRETFKSLGGFDESFFCYGEDVDLGFRLRLTGGRAVQIAAARVLHEGSGVTGRRSDFTIYHGNRNRIWLTFKNMPGALYWPLFPVRLAVDVVLLIRAALRGEGRVYARALADGYSGLGARTQTRRRLQSQRKASAADIARALEWSLLKIGRRAPSLRPLSTTPD